MCKGVFSHKTPTHHMKQKNARCLFVRLLAIGLHQGVPALQAGHRPVCKAGTPRVLAFPWPPSPWLPSSIHPFKPRARSSTASTFDQKKKQGQHQKRQPSQNHIIMPPPIKRTNAMAMAFSRSADSRAFSNDGIWLPPDGTMICNPASKMG